MTFILRDMTIRIDKDLRKPKRRRHALSAICPIGCGVCTTKCVFDAISLIRHMPEASVMVKSEDKLKYVLPNMIKQSVKVTFKPRKGKPV